MRIIAGEFRSRTLVTPEGLATRPTMDRAREALFNVLSNMISFEGISVLDLYAGSGALGFEALSRGAAHVTLVDKSQKAIRAIEKNAEALHVGERITLIRLDVHKFLATRVDSFDLVFADPPYEASDVNTLAQIIQKGWLAPHGYFVIEHRSNSRLAPVPNTTIVRELNAGEARFTILTHTI